MKRKAFKCAVALCILMLALLGGASAQSLETPQTKPVKVRSVAVTPKKKTLKVGDTLQLSAAIKPAEAPQQLTFKSSNKKVASVDADGLVSAHRRGSATITVSAKNGRKAKCKITVKQPVVSLKLGKSTLVLLAGKSKKIGCKVSPSSANDKRVSWKSSSTKVATVSQAGVVKARHPGSCTITATSKDGSVQSRCTVTVSQSKALIDKYASRIKGDYLAMEPDDLSVDLPELPEKIFVPGVTMQRLHELFPSGFQFCQTMSNGSVYDAFEGGGMWSLYPRGVLSQHFDKVQFDSSIWAVAPPGQIPLQCTNRGIRCGDSIQTVLDTYGVPHVRYMDKFFMGGWDGLSDVEILVYRVAIGDGWGDLRFLFHPETQTLQMFSVLTAAYSAEP